MEWKHVTLCNILYQGISIADHIFYNGKGVDSWGYTQKTVTPEAPAHPYLLRHYSQ
jgi:hypothetical protein